MSTTHFPSEDLVSCRPVFIQSYTEEEIWNASQEIRLALGYGVVKQSFCSAFNHPSYNTFTVLASVVW